MACPTRADDLVDLLIVSRESETVMDEITHIKRGIGISVGAFYIFDPAIPLRRAGFVEAVALGSLDDAKVDTINPPSRAIEQTPAS